MSECVCACGLWYHLARGLFWQIVQIIVLNLPLRWKITLTCPTKRQRTFCRTSCGEVSCRTPCRTAWLCFCLSYYKRQYICQPAAIGPSTPRLLQDFPIFFFCQTLGFCWPGHQKATLSGQRQSVLGLKLAEFGGEVLEMKLEACFGYWRLLERVLHSSLPPELYPLYLLYLFYIFHYGLWSVGCRKLILPIFTKTIDPFTVTASVDYSTYHFLRPMPLIEPAWRYPWMKLPKAGKSFQKTISHAALTWLALAFPPKKK